MYLFFSCFRLSLQLPEGLAILAVTKQIPAEMPAPAGADIIRQEKGENHVRVFICAFYR